jgi:cell division protein FtsI (penicillin-binding protein 3)
MAAILLVFTLLGTVAMLRLGYWQVVAAPELAAQAVRSMTPATTVQLARAAIVDRNGKVLALTTSRDRLDAHPADIDSEDRQGIVDTLTPILGLDADEQQQYLERLSGDDLWTWLKRRLTPKESAAIQLAIDERRLRGISLAPHDMRAYPRDGGQGGTTLASHLIGFVAGDQRGAYGVERLYEDRLTGTDLGTVDIAALQGAADLGLDATDIPPLALTIDWRLQWQVEKELSAARVAMDAKSVSAVLMDPYTGEILASASVPGYDANDFAAIARDRMSLLRDPNVSEVFEPGSVLKIFTAVAALEKGVVTPQTRIKDEPKIEFYKYVVDNSDKKGRGMITVKDVIAMSRNVAIAKIAQRLAPRSTQKAAHQLYDLWDKVGLVGQTGVDIAGEEAGLFCDPDTCQWAPVDLANQAFGQGVAVTMMQLARSFSTLVNGGYRVQPHVVAESDAAQVPPERVLRPKVARQALEILEHVTGSRAHYAQGSLIPGYMIGGKTGTAQIWDSKRGEWKDNIFNHNFVGYVGGNKPEVVIAVRIEEPKNKVLGQGHIEIKIESYELFRNVARGAIKHLHIKKSKDKEAGLPLLGTDAARTLTPWRTGSALKPRAKAQVRQKAKGTKAARAQDGSQASRAAKQRRSGEASAARHDRAGGDAAASRTGQRDPGSDASTRAAKPSSGRDP